MNVNSGEACSRPLKKMRPTEISPPSSSTTTTDKNIGVSSGTQPVLIQTPGNYGNAAPRQTDESPSLENNLSVNQQIVPGTLGAMRKENMSSGSATTNSGTSEAAKGAILTVSKSPPTPNSFVDPKPPMSFLPMHIRQPDSYPNVSEEEGQLESQDIKETLDVLHPDAKSDMLVDAIETFGEDLILADEESVNCLLQMAASMNPQWFETIITRYEVSEDEGDGRISKSTGASMSSPIYQMPRGPMSGPGVTADDPVNLMDSDEEDAALESNGNASSNPAPQIQHTEGGSTDL